MTDIVERLRFELRDWNGHNRTHFFEVNALTVAEAADTIEALRAEVEALRGADRRTFSPTEIDQAVDATVERVARKAMHNTEIARTDVVNPANGAASYSYVMFHGQRTDFHNGEFELPRDAATGKAAAYATAINEGLFDLAKRAVSLARCQTKANNTEHIAVLEKWLGEQSDYEGDDPRARHYRRNRAALSAAIAALTARSDGWRDIESAPRLRRCGGANISGIWQQAAHNHDTYSAQGTPEDDLRFGLEAPK